MFLALRPHAARIERFIYVEILIHAPIDTVWAHTQTPALHEQWDLRFSRIDYLPKANGSDLQRFRYSTRIGFGVDVSGEGETAGSRDLPNGSRSSALKFGSSAALSLIHEGSGYWKYIPTSDGIRFLTSYDYRTRFGAVGALVDRLIFRPLIGWATAWSFDRLRLWLENGVSPAQSMRQTLVHAVARVSLAVIFAYQGLIPKIVTQHPHELLHNAGVPIGSVHVAVAALGVVELILSALLLFRWLQRWPASLSLGGVIAAAAVVGVGSPHYFGAAFNPFSMNLAVACLAAVDLLVLSGLPSAARCGRVPRPEAT